MTDPNDGTPLFNRATRVPLEAVVRLHFEGEVSYQNGFSANVSATGMFVKHPEPHALGTHLAFEFLVGARRRPVQGVGHVVWLRAKYEGPGKPAGMGILYDELDAASREHLTEALFDFLEESVAGELSAEEDEGVLPAVAASAATVASAAGARPAAPGQPFRLGLDLEPNGHEPTAEALTSDAMIDEVSAKQPSERQWASAPPAIEPPAPPQAVERPDFWHAAREPLQPAPAEPEPPELEELAAEPRRTPWPAIGGLAALAILAGVWYWMRLPAPTEPLPPAQSAVREPAPEVLPVATRPTTMPSDSATPPTAAPLTPSPVAPETSTAVAPPAAESAPAVSRFDTLREIRVRPEAGATTVELFLNGSIAAGDYAVAPMAGENPRLLVKLRRVSAPYTRGQVTAGSPELRGIRTGYHEAATGNDLHVVLDLGNSDPRRAEVTPQGSRLLVRLPGRS